MKKLISAGLARLKKDKIFWICLIALLLYTLISMLNSCRQALLPEMSEYAYTLDRYYYSYSLHIGLFCAVFISLHINTEYRDGTMRNKIITGHGRLEIYLSNLIVSLTAILSMLLVCLAGGLAGIPFIGPWQSFQKLAVYLLISLLYVAAYTAIFTLVSMLFTHKALSQILTILLFLGLLLLAGNLYTALQEPEMISNITITMEEGMKMADPTPNPKYVSGDLRNVYQFLVDFLPTGQCLQMYSSEIAHPLRMMLSSLSIFIGTTAIGIVFFRRKDLN
ncbi:ABC transporter permease [bacterium D16-50]|jgi:ABC-2 type transport system permease protein|nr:ABC transporter permease subunit [Lachnospiraceae bacterium]RKJ21723.1 ABC transporter permease [bacterium D16-50]